MSLLVHSFQFPNHPERLTILIVPTLSDEIQKESQVRHQLNLKPQIIRPGPSLQKSNLEL